MGWGWVGLGVDQLSQYSAVQYSTVQSSSPEGRDGIHRVNYIYPALPIMYIIHITNLIIRKFDYVSNKKEERNGNRNGNVT